MNLIDELYQSDQLLLNLGKEGFTIPLTDFYLLNKKVFSLANELYTTKYSSLESKGKAYLSILIAYNLCIHFADVRKERIQNILNKISQLLPQLQPSILKAELLLWLYEIVKDRNILLDARQIIVSWGGRELSKEENKLIEWHNEIIS